jgi:hypothetical protein
MKLWGADETQKPVARRRFVIPPVYRKRLRVERRKLLQCLAGVAELMEMCNVKTPPTRVLVKGLALELDLDESRLEKLAAEVRKHLAAE